MDCSNSTMSMSYNAPNKVYTLYRIDAHELGIFLTERNVLGSYMRFVLVHKFLWSRCCVFLEHNRLLVSVNILALGYVIL